MTDIIWTWDSDGTYVPPLMSAGQTVIVPATKSCDIRNNVAAVDCSTRLCLKETSTNTYIIIIARNIVDWTFFSNPLGSKHP